MRIFSYFGRGRQGVGVMASGTTFVPLEEAAPELPARLQEILELPDGLERVRAAVAGKTGTRDVSEATFLPPSDTPNAIWALALNFKQHIAETGLTTSAEHPHVFLRHAHSLVGHGQALRCPPPELSNEHDYEGELGVVIGRAGRHIPLDRALDHVAGFTCVNEGSVREFQRHNRNFGLGKNFEESGSIGPWIVTPDEFGPVAQHTLVTRLNGIERQRSSLGDMLFSVEQVIAYLSTGHVLRPGDVISMGTPGALPRDPKDTVDPSRQRGRHVIPTARASMRPGDTVEVEIDGIGVLANLLVADAPVAYYAGVTA